MVMFNNVDPTKHRESVTITYTEHHTPEEAEMFRMKDAFFRSWLTHIDNGSTNLPAEVAGEVLPLKNKPFYRQNQRW